MDAYPEGKDEEFPTIKPLIKELVRTQYCFPDLVLLVDKIIIAKVPSDGDSDDVEAYRLYLTDRQKSIQAILKRRLHKHVIRDGLREGSYIVLKDYRLARSPRIKGTGNVQYIAIYDYYVIGQDSRYESSESSSASKQRSRTRSVSVDGDQPSAGSEFERYDTVQTKSVKIASIDNVGNPQSKLDESDSGPAQVSVRKSVDTPSSPRTLVASDSSNFRKATEIIGNEMKRQRDEDDHHGVNSEVHPPEKKQCKNTEVKATLNEVMMNPGLRQAESPWARKAKALGKPLQPVDRPLRLSTLASVTGVNRSRNKVVDILALIDSVDESAVKPARLPLKRDIRITDGSTDRKFTVSIFVDPADCVPTAGEIVLFRNLVTHDWKQGALNAYPKYCDGKDWYIPDPERVEGRGLELKDLKAKILIAEEDRRKSAKVAS